MKHTLEPNDAGCRKRLRSTARNDPLQEGRVPLVRNDATPGLNLRFTNLLKGITRTVHAQQVQGRNFVFEYPDGSGEYYVLLGEGPARSSPAPMVHPWMQHDALKLLQANPPKDKRRGKDKAGPCDPATLMTRFGYRGKSDAQSAYLYVPSLPSPPWRSMT